MKSESVVAYDFAKYIQMKELTFPLLDYNEILTSLKDLEISCSIQGE